MAQYNEQLREVARDGRQSPQALAIARGVLRLMRAHHMAALPELTLASGRRCDIACVSAKGDIWIIEIKSSVADFRSDHKWREYQDFCDQLYFAVDQDFPLELLPDNVGVIVADRYAADFLRDSTEARLAAGRRKAVLLDFARAAAFRLMAASDPGMEFGADWKL
ncbi:MAG: hypothetical protein RLZ98_966 [Pseudomonadota bacterium]|jgi:hypothetical protein